MSTRSAIARDTGTHDWRGRYCHSDGYPTHQGKALWRLVKRDGVEKVLQVVTEDHYGWSYVDPDMPSIEGVTPDPPGAYNYGTPGYYAARFAPDGSNGDGRFAVVPGYGIAYTTVAGQSSPDEWVTPTDDWGIEFVYVLNDHHMHVLTEDGIPLAMVLWDDPEPDWQAIENRKWGEH